MGQGPSRGTRGLLRRAEMGLERRPQPLQTPGFLGELLRLHADATEMLRLGRHGGNGVGKQRPLGRQLRWLELALPNLQQPSANGFHIVTRQLALTGSAAKDHDLLELRIDSAVDAQIGEVPRQPADQLLIEHVGRHDENQDAVVLQQRQRLLVEQLLQPCSAFAVVTHVAAGILGQVAIRRVEPQQAEALTRDQRVHQIAVDAAIDQLACVVGARLVVLHGECGDLLTPEGMGGLRDGHTFSGAGIEDADRPIAGHQCVERSFKRCFVGRVIAVLGEIPGDAGEHECHGSLLVGGDEKEWTRPERRVPIDGVRPRPPVPAKP